MRLQLLFNLILLFGLTACFQAEVAVEREIASTHVYQPDVEQGEKWGSREEAMVDEIANIFRETLIDSTGDAPLMRRDAHPKHHGCVASSLTIDHSQLPEKYRVGLFSENRLYQTIIRFSNGDPDHTKADLESDVRGMAVKILNTSSANYLQKVGLEESENVHDLVFMNADAFFIPNPKQYEKFMKATKGRFGVLGYLALHWGTLRSILRSRVQVSNSLDIDYASATPYKLGETSMKMKFASCRKENEKDVIPKKASPNFLSERLEESLSKKDECFDFFVQVNQDKKRNEIEDAMIVWDEERSPFLKVGQLNIKKQSGFRTKERMSACENMSFNPWRAPEENRPLGGVNRIRLEVYLNQSKLRREYNEISIQDGL